MPRKPKAKAAVKSKKKRLEIDDIKPITNGGNYPLINIEESTSDTFASDSTQAVAAPDGSLFVVQEIEELIEHICAKCERTFDNLEVLKQHLPSCRRSTLNFAAENSDEYGVQHFVLDIPRVVNGMLPPMAEPKSRVVLALNDYKPDNTTDDDFEDPTEDELTLWESYTDTKTCHCCGEKYDIAHVGHIRCRKCPKSFKDIESFRKHTLILHSRNVSHPCDKCNAQLVSKKMLELHQLAHITSMKQFCCRGCGREFTRKYHLDRHLKYLNCDGTRPVIKHPCNVCGQSFARTDNLKEHLKSHIGPKQSSKDFACPYCPKAFVGSSLLNIHIRTHTGERPFVCDICKNGFPSNGALRKHRRTHTGEKPYKCEFCDSRFAAKETLNRHTKTHTGEKKYGCQFCDARFIQNSQLKAHMKAHDSSITWDCKLCTEKFETVRLLHIHHRNAHKMGKIYQCNFCNNIYVTKAELKRHIDGVHLNRRNFKCQQCRKRFVTKGQLDIHSYIHRIEDPVRCKLCLRMFRRKDCYKRHIRTRHREYFEKAISTAEMRKIKKIESDNQDTTYVIENVPIRDLGTLEVTTNQDGNIIEFIIPTEMEDEHMEACSTETDKNELTFSGLDERIATMKAESCLTEDYLEIYSKQLLELLLDATTLEDFGHPDSSVFEILSGIIDNCGGKPFNEEDVDNATKIRENVKLFFTLVMESEQIKSLLNNHTVDEVIQYILKYLQSDE